MSIKTKMIQLFCNHNEQESISTITPSYMDNLYRGINTNIFIFRCTRCRKIIYRSITEPKFNPFYYDYIVKTNKLKNIDKKEKTKDEACVDEGYSII